MAKMNIGKDNKTFRVQGWIIFLPTIIFAVGMIVGYFTNFFEINIGLIGTIISLSIFLIIGCTIWLIKSKVLFYLINILFIGIGLVIAEMIGTLDTSLPEVVLLIIFIVSAPILLFIGVLVTLSIKMKVQSNKRRNYAKKVLSDEYVGQLVENLGGKENIISASNSVSRLKVKLKDVESANLEGIQEISKKGVFVAGQDVQIIFSEEAVTYLEYYINNQIK